MAEGWLADTRKSLLPTLDFLLPFLSSTLSGLPSPPAPPPPHTQVMDYVNKIVPYQ